MAELRVEQMIDEETIRHRIQELAREIEASVAGETITAICVLKGSLLFFADLVRALRVDVRFDYIALSSYGEGTESSGTVHVVADLSSEIEGKHVLVVEDIVDSGHTLVHLRALLEDRHPKSLRVVSLLSKPERREVEVPVEFIGFEVPNEFIVGFGLDMDQKFRSLPYIGKICSEI